MTDKKIVSNTILDILNSCLKSLNLKYFTVYKALQVKLFYLNAQ